MKFPEINTYDVNQTLVRLPQGLAGDLNLLLLSYGVWHVWQFDSWLPFAKRLQDSYRAFEFYALSTIENVPSFGNNVAKLNQWPHDNEPIAAQRILTTYVDKSILKSQLGIASELNIAVLLLNRNGSLLWCEYGAWSPEKADKLDTLLMNVASLYDEDEP